MFLGDIDATVTMQGERIKKDGDVYFNVKDFYVDFNIGHASIQLDDLFNGDKELGQYHLFVLISLFSYIITILDFCENKTIINTHNRLSVYC